MKKLYFLGILALIMIVSVACGSSSETNKKSSESSDSESYVLKVSSAYSSSSIPQANLEKFNELLQERSDGRLSLEIYPNAQLVPADQEISAVLNGEIDMSFQSSGYLSAIEPSYYFFDLPFMFKDDPSDLNVYLNHRKEFFNSEQGGKEIARRLEEKGLLVLSNISAIEPSYIFTRKKEDMITDLASIKNKKIRVIGGEVVPKVLDAVNATGVPIPTAELTTALQQGVIDGLVTSPTYVLDYQWPLESVSFFTMLGYANPIVINKQKFESLPSDLQEILVEVGKEVEQFSEEHLLKRYSTVFDELEEQNIEIHYPTDEELKEWKSAVEPVYNWYVENIEGGQAILDAAKAN